MQGPVWQQANRERGAGKKSRGAGERRQGTDVVVLTAGWEVEMKQIESERLLFKQFGEADAAFMKAYLADPLTTRFLPLEGPYSEDQACEYVSERLRHWERHGFGVFILWEKSEDRPIGYCGLEYAGDTDFIDIRYGLIRKAQGRGLAGEAAARCINYGFHSLGLPVIYAAVVSENLASKAILNKLGMKPDRSFDYYGEGVDTFSVAASMMIEGSSHIIDSRFPCT